MMKIKVSAVWKWNGGVITGFEEVHEASIELLEDSTAARATAIGLAVLEALVIIRRAHNEVQRSEVSFTITFDD